MQEWFISFFDRDSPESSAYFVSRRDVGPEHLENCINPLQKQCDSARDCFQIPYHNAYGTTLYDIMMRRPDLFLCWHNSNSGSFYLRIGCRNCSSVTGFYQPQGQVDDLGLNPRYLGGKALKELEVVRQAFRCFLGEILERPDLVIGERCRHLHRDVPGRVQALANAPFQ